MTRPDSDCIVKAKQNEVFTVAVPTGSGDRCCKKSGVAFPGTLKWSRATRLVRFSHGTLFPAKVGTSASAPDEDQIRPNA